MKKEIFSVKFPHSGEEHSAIVYWFKPIYEALTIGIGIFVVISLTSYFVYHEARKALISEIGRGLISTANSIASQLDISSYQSYKTDSDRDNAYLDAERLFRKVIDRNTLGSADIAQLNKVDRAVLQQCFAYHAAVAKGKAPDPKNHKSCKQLRETIFKNQSISYIYTFRLVNSNKDTDQANCNTENNYQFEFVFDMGQTIDYEAYTVEEITENLIKYDEKSSIGDCYEDKNEELDGAFLHYIETPRASAQTGVAETILRQDEFGILISGYAPLYNINDEFIGLLGVDINANEFEIRLEPLENAIIRTIVSGFFIAFLIGALVWFLRNFSRIINDRRLQLIADVQTYLDNERKQK